jgi:hypothetical protein
MEIVASELQRQAGRGFGYLVSEGRLTMDVQERIFNARRLIASGHPKEACAMLRPLLEQYLRDRCMAAGIQSDRMTIGAMVANLFDVGKIDSGERARFLNWNTFGNIGSHATADAVSVEDAQYFLLGVSERLGMPEQRSESHAGTNPAMVRKSGGSRTHDKLSDEQRHNTLIAAFYLPRFGHEHLQLGNQDETFAAVADRLRVKKTTLKNYRDTFDPHTDSGRRGWWQKDLGNDERGVLNEFRRPH